MFLFSFLLFFTVFCLISLPLELFCDSVTMQPWKKAIVMSLRFLADR